jgi:PPP4R2
MSVVESVPDLLLQHLNAISQTLRTCFAEKPPHTIQRLAELILFPTKHYNTLPAWLRAVDRAVSVTSTADIFPLPQAQSLPQGLLASAITNGATNGLGAGPAGSGILWTNSDSRDAGLGSDESLGGALLTPIPWLKNGEIAGTTSPRSDPLDPLDVHGGAFVSEREHGAVTQGELIRIEQEAGIVPVSQTTMGEAADIDLDGDGGDSIPHARGPDIVGVEDLGLQDGKDVELQISHASPKTGELTVEERNPGSDSVPEDRVKMDSKQGRQDENAATAAVKDEDEEIVVEEATAMEVPTHTISSNSDEDLLLVDAEEGEAAKTENGGGKDGGPVQTA